MSTTLRIEALSGAHRTGLTALFRRADIPCFCQYHGFTGDHRDWQNRCANEREENVSGLARDLESGRLRGAVALASDEVVGYVRVARHHELPKTYEGRVYRGLPCFTGDRRDVWAVSCFVVDPSWRRQGVARAVLDCAIEQLRASGAAALEAFPRGATDVSDEEQWTGPLALYERAGFAVVRDFAPYPVLRLDLRA